MSKKIWYLLELDAHTNEVMSREIPPEMANQRVLCRDGEERKLWECEYSTVAKFLRNEQQMNLKFIVYYSVGRNSVADLWPFTRREKQTLAQAVQKGVVKKNTA